MKFKKLTATIGLAALLSAFGGVAAALPADAEPAGDAHTVATVNVLRGKVPTTNATEPLQPGSAEVMVAPEKATDGSVAYEGDEAGVTEIAAGPEVSSEPMNGWENWKDVYLQYALDDPREIREVRLYHNQYSTSVSTFKNVRVQIATDAEFTDVVYDSGFADYQETAQTQGQAQVVTLDKPVTGQHVRIWQRGHYIESTSSSWKGMSNKVRFREIEVMASATEDEAAALTPRNIAAGKIPYVWGLAPTNIAAISDGDWDTYATHNTPGENWLQFEFKNSYDVTSIKLGLEPGTYESIKAFVLAGPSATISKTTGLPEGGGAPVYSASSLTVDGPITMEFPATKGSTVRFVLKKDEAGPVKFSEVEIMATGDSYDESDPVYKAPDSPFTKLVWSDEFNGTRVDESKWNIISGMANHGAIYNRDAVSIKHGIEGEESNGYLAINSKNYGTTDVLVRAVGHDPYPGEPLKDKQTWSSGRVESKNKYSFEYGRMAVRAKVNDSQGIWPAIWMLAQDETGHDEIDVLEYLGQEPWTAYMTNHYGVWGHNKGQDSGTAGTYESWSQKFHVYEVEWTPQEITWFIDGQKRFATARDCAGGCDSRHSLPMFPILETQVGDGWVGDVDYAKRWTKQDSDFLVDWVRVYQNEDQDRVRFDDLEAERPADGEYRLAPISQTNVVAKTTGTALADDKNNFFYGGQPRYEDSRLVSADKPGELVYKAAGLKEVRLTAYYKTVAGQKTLNGVNNQWEGTSIRSVTRDGQLDFAVYASPDGKTWSAQELSTHNNFVDAPPAYARHTVTARGLPADTEFVKIVFPDVSGVTYRVGDSDVAVEAGDVQLAKVTFLQERRALDWTELLPATPVEPSVPATDPAPATVPTADPAPAASPAPTVAKPESAQAGAATPRSLPKTGATVGSLLLLAAGVCGTGVVVRRQAKSC
ncbi:MAG: glycoside hydrolase family 16 protein [Trueperella sp.]|uniref:glycoside hydrolase family 16 protein n=1 Tax=Trueperella sp. TaxID=2699835 RepID=UPI002A91603E|nr:glycoside hydrolase family 16 protein [Trueperella sp.]MDY5403772.1 glycoside hydrolase family 16 protein [Trueperella sp.]